MVAHDGRADPGPDGTFVKNAGSGDTPDLATSPTDAAQRQHRVTLTL